jgi:predicted amidohydrolase
MKIRYIMQGILLMMAVVAGGCGNEKPSDQDEFTVRNRVDGAIKLALVQMKVEGGEPDLNLRHASERIARAADEGAHLALLPEVMDLGWTHPSAKILAYPVPGGKTFEKLADAARKNQIYVVAGIVEKDVDKTYNTAVLIGPDGKLLLKHRKLNELDIAHDLYDTGDRLNVCHTELGTIGLMICADAGAREYAIQRSLGYMGADMILSPSSWAVVADHDNEKEPYGDTWRNNYIPVAREFQLWIIGVSNVGWLTAGPWKGWKCIGCSLVIDPDGNEVLQAPYGADADTIIYLEVETRDRPARGTGWQEYWKQGQ